MPHGSAKELLERGDEAARRIGGERMRMRTLSDLLHHTPPDQTARLAELSSQIDELAERISADEARVSEMEALIARVAERNGLWARALRLRYRKGLNIKGVATMLSTSHQNATGILKRGTAYADKLLAG